MKQFHLSIKDFCYKSAIAAVVAFAVASCGGSQIEVISPDSEVTDSIPAQALNVFVENSGSMDGYMAPDASLTDAVYSYVSRLGEHADTTRLYYINSTVIPYGGSLSNFIGDLTPEAFAAAGGNRSNSDMAAMIGRFLDSVSDTTTSIFVSDCILDLNTTGAASTASQLNNRRIAISNAVSATLKRVPSLGIVVLKMESPFSGRYFYPDGRTTTLDGAPRPYYIWLAGRRDYLATLLRDVPAENIVGHGFREMAGFTRPVAVSYRVTNQAMNGNTVTAVGNQYTLYISADMRPTLQPEAAQLDTAYYRGTGLVPGMSIKRIGQVTNPDSPYSIFLEVAIDRNSRIDQEKILFTPPALPEWVEQTDDSGISDVEGRLDRTVGIGALLRGVVEGFNNKNELTDFTFELKRK